MDLKQAVKDLQDAMVVMAHLEKRHAETLRDHEEMLRNHAEYLGEMTEYRRRIDQNLAEITDKLNGLIGYVAGYRPPPPSA